MFEGLKLTLSQRRNTPDSSSLQLRREDIILRTYNIIFLHQSGRVYGGGSGGFQPEIRPLRLCCVRRYLLGFLLPVFRVIKAGGGAEAEGF